MEREQFYACLRDVKTLDEASLDDLKGLTQTFPWFQAGWLLYLKGLKNVEAAEYQEVLKKVAIMVPDRKNLFKFLNSELPKPSVSIEGLKSTLSIYQLKGEEGSNGSNSLIDKFLSSNQERIRKTLDSNIVNNSEASSGLVERSVAENDELITETLASIYFQQKNYQKAQEAYQKLSLKYPEKSVYFASRIKEIEVLKNNK